GFVFVKHRGNIKRLLAGTENRIGDLPMRDTLVRGVHVLALGLWFGGAAFFNLVAAVPIFDSFKQVVNDSPSDRTAYVNIVPPGTTDEQKKDLANALAGSAVGPVFPRYFAMGAICGVLALVTALSWWKTGKVGRWRVCVIAAALLTVVIGWPISNYVSELRLERFSQNTEVATAAKAAFATWHLVSLLLSFVAVCLTAVALALAARMPQDKRTG